MKKIVLATFMLISVGSFANNKNEEKKKTTNTLSCSGTTSGGDKITIQCGTCSAQECYTKLEKAKKSLSEA